MSDQPKTTPIPPWAPCKRPLGCDYPDCECHSQTTTQTEEWSDWARREIVKLHGALDSALDPKNTWFIADYYKGHLSYVNMIAALGDQVASRVYDHRQRIADAKR